MVHMVLAILLWDHLSGTIYGTWLFLKNPELSINFILWLFICKALQQRLYGAIETYCFCADKRVKIELNYLSKVEEKRQKSCAQSINQSIMIFQWPEALSTLGTIVANIVASVEVA